MAYHRRYVRAVARRVWGERIEVEPNAGVRPNKEGCWVTARVFVPKAALDENVGLVEREAE